MNFAELTTTTKNRERGPLGSPCGPIGLFHSSLNSYWSREQPRIWNLSAAQGWCSTHCESVSQVFKNLWVFEIFLKTFKNFYDECWFNPPVTFICNMYIVKCKNKFHLIPPYLKKYLTFFLMFSSWFLCLVLVPEKHFFEWCANGARWQRWKISSSIM